MVSRANRSYRFYCGKKVAFIYKGHTEKRGTKIRVIWGKVTRPHGESTSPITAVLARTWKESFRC